METETQVRRPGVGIVVFETTMRAAVAALPLVTLAAVVLVALYLTGRGPIELPASIDPPYAVRLLDGTEREIQVGPSGSVGERANFEAGEESRYLKSAPAVSVRSRVDRDDTDTRLAVCVAGAVALGLLWAVALNLWLVARSARDRDPFAPANAARLRRVAAALVAVPVVGIAASEIVERTLESDPPVSVVSPGWGWLGFVVAGAAVLALAEVFREGAALRQFERETI